MFSFLYYNLVYVDLKQIWWNPERHIEKQLVFLTMYVRLVITDWSYIKKFPELTSPVCSSLKLICLAEGQVSFLILLTVDCD